MPNKTSLNVISAFILFENSYQPPLEPVEVICHIQATRRVTGPNDLSPSEQTKTSPNRPPRKANTQFKGNY